MYCKRCRKRVSHRSKPELLALNHEGGASSKLEIRYSWFEVCTIHREVRCEPLDPRARDHRNPVPVLRLRHAAVERLHSGLRSRAVRCRQENKNVTHSVSCITFCQAFLHAANKEKRHKKFRALRALLRRRVRARNLRLLLLFAGDLICRVGAAALAFPFPFPFDLPIESRSHFVSPVPGRGKLTIVTPRWRAALSLEE